MSRHPISITIDFERSGPDSTVAEARRAIEPLLDLLELRGASITFFVVGDIAGESSSLLRTIAAHGHEIGLHGLTHVPLEDLGPSIFDEQVTRGRRILEDAAGVSVTGFRAPYFSLTPRTMWAPEILSAGGFEYSSSVLPAWNPQYGFPGAPKRPYLWPSGLVELPSPVLGIGPIALPVLGGAYLRLAPWPLVKWAAQTARRHTAAWTYCHPYDFDVDEGYRRRPGESAVFSRLLFARRGKMLPRIDSLADDTSTTLVSIAGSLRKSGLLPVWPTQARTDRPSSCGQ